MRPCALGLVVLCIVQDNVATNEKAILDAAKSLVESQVAFRADDLDGNGSNDYWVKDVAGLFGMKNKEGKQIKLIGVELARSDVQRKEEYEGIGKCTSYKGYSCRQLAEYETKDKKKAKFDEGSGRNGAMFAIVIYPEDYPKSGKRTFVITDMLCVYAKDTGGKAPDVMPLQPEKGGWEVVFEK